MSACRLCTVGSWDGPAETHTCPPGPRLCRSSAQQVGPRQLPSNYKPSAERPLVHCLGQIGEKLGWVHWAGPSCYRLCSDVGVEIWPMKLI